MSRLVLLESPYAGDIPANVEYGRRCMADCFRRGEYPFASHLLYTQDGVLRDSDPAERALGIDAGLAWGEKADATVVYTDRGISSGMRQGIERAEAAGRPVELRSLSGLRGVEPESAEDVMLSLDPSAQLAVVFAGFPTLQPTEDYPLVSVARQRSDLSIGIPDFDLAIETKDRTA